MLREATREHSQVAQRARSLANARLAVFLVGLVAFFGPLALGAGVPPMAAVIAGTSILVFIGLVNVHERVDKRLRRSSARAQIFQEALHRVHRTWSALETPAGAPGPEEHPYAVDIDVTGSASLEQLLDTPKSGIGRDTLRAWLLTSADVGTVGARQEAVRELADRGTFLDDLAVEARVHAPKRTADTRTFIEWAEEVPVFRHKLWLRTLCWLSPLALIIAAVARLAGWTALPLWMVPFAVNLLITARLRAPVARTYRGAFAAGKAVQQYRALFQTISAARFEAALLKSIHARLLSAGEPAHEAMRRLARVADLSDVRYSMFHLPIQLLLLWDQHLLFALERWQERAGPHVSDWLDAVGEAEALAALGALARANPDWAFPVLDPDAGPGFDAHGLGHPLLAADVRVTNDVQLGPPGTLLLVTGSNMSGKSTLLRAIGCNVVLAQAGGPVCAQTLRMRPVTLHTSMRVHDSLEAGVSYFMAGLRRLKAVVDAASAAQRDPDSTLLYLLDEILQGTNTAERRIAVERIVRFLVQSGAIGAVTTHDLSLTNIPEIQRVSNAVYFTETVDDGRMHFDYQLRPGVATSRNALRLMELIGLPTPASPETETPQPESCGDT